MSRPAPFNKIKEEVGSPLASRPVGSTAGS
jgi:hypothetical protein